jgi:hypothetical protein
LSFNQCIFSPKAKEVVKEVMQNCASILKKVPHIYQACMNVQHGLSKWNQKHPYKPIVTMIAFENDIVHNLALYNHFHDLAIKPICQNENFF